MSSRSANRLRHLAARLPQPQSFGSFADKLARAIKDTTTFTRVVICRSVSEGRELLVAGVSGLPGLPLGVKFPPKDAAAVIGQGTMLERGKSGPRILKLATTAPWVMEPGSDESTEWAAMGIVFGDEVLGLILADEDGAPLDEDSMSVLGTAYAEITASWKLQQLLPLEMGARAVESSYPSLRRMKSDLATSLLVESGTLGRSMEEICKHAIGLTKALGCEISILEDAQYKVAGQAGEFAKIAQELAVGDPDAMSSITVRCMHEGKRIIHEGRRDDAFINRMLSSLTSEAERAQLLSVQAWGAFPVGTIGNVVGALSIWSQEVHFFDMGVEAVCEMLADEVADVLQTETLCHELRDLRNETHPRYKELVEKARRASASAAQAGLARVVIHNIESPLSAIGSNLQAIRPGLQRYLGNTGDLGILTAMDEAARTLIRVLGVYRRMRVGEHEHEGEVNLYELLAELKTLWEGSPTCRGVAIDLSGSPKLPTLLGRESEFFLAFNNLLGNAVHALQSRKNRQRKRIRVRVTFTDVALSVTIEDNGVGMNQESLRRLREGIQFTTRPGEGTGLGSVFVRDIVRRHRGEISYESRENVGTSVTIKLPLRRRPRQ